MAHPAGNPHVPLLLGHSTRKKDDNFHIVMEYMAGGSLRQYLLRNEDTLSAGDRQDLAIQCAEAVASLHSMNVQHPDGRSGPVIHRDIKPDNFVISASGQVKICQPTRTQLATACMLSAR